MTATQTAPHVPAQVVATSQRPEYTLVPTVDLLRLQIENYRNEIRHLLRANARLRHRLEHSYVAEVENKNRMLHAQLRRLKEENVVLKSD